MHTEIVISAATLQSFSLAFARVSGIFIFVPMPGVRRGPAIVRLVISIAVTLALYTKWPQASMSEGEPGLILLWGLSELALGVSIGLLVSCIIETLSFGAQAISLPAGYTYASSVDPSTQAESNILISLAQLLSGLLFFAFELHHPLILAIARSFDRFPPGSFSITEDIVVLVVKAGSAMLSIGFGLMVPILTVLLMIDVGLALLGRLNASVQVTIVSFPTKILASLVMLSLLGTVIPSVFRKTASAILPLVWQILGP